MDGDSLQAFAEETATAGGEAWKALLSLFKANSRSELVTLLGFSKEEIAARVADAVENLKNSTTAKSPFEEDITPAAKPHESVVSFAEPESQEVPSDRSDAGDEAAVALEQTPSELSVGITSDTQQADGESTTTATSLFGDDIPGTPHHEFFNTVGVAQDNGESHAVLVPHMNYGLDSSVAATIGSGPSSVTSESTKNNGFRIYPSEESETDGLVTKALVLGDFESAVSLCLFWIVSWTPSSLLCGAVRNSCNAPRRHTLSAEPLNFLIFASSSPLSPTIWATSFRTRTCKNGVKFSSYCAPLRHRKNSLHLQSNSVVAWSISLPWRRPQMIPM